jgi:hypothetical protein
MNFLSELGDICRMIKLPPMHLLDIEQMDLI